MWLIWTTAAAHMLDWAPIDYKALDSSFFGIFSFERKQYTEIIFGLPSVYAFCAQLNPIKVATETKLAAPNRFSYRKHFLCEKFVTKAQITHHPQLLAFIAKCLFQFLMFVFFFYRWKDDIYGFVAIRKLINFYLLTVWHVWYVFVSRVVHIIPQSIQSIEVHWSGTSRWEKRPHGNGSTQVVWLCLWARCDISTSVHRFSTRSHPSIFMSLFYRNVYMCANENFLICFVKKNGWNDQAADKVHLATCGS